MRYHKKNITAYASVWMLMSGIFCYGTELRQVPELHNLRAVSGDSRVDLIWDQPSAYNVAGDEALFFEIVRRGPGAKEFKRINKLLWTTNVYGDFIGEISGDYTYRVRGIFVSEDGETKSYSAWSPEVVGSPHKSTTEGLLTEIQEASFRYFYDYRHPISGLAREKTPYRRAEKIDELTVLDIKDARGWHNLCTTGASGMGMFNLVVGVERGFISREEGVAWALQMLRFLDTKAERFHGAFSHWLMGSTGKTRPFAGKEDNAADIVETAFLASGFIVLREYFSGSNPEEREIRKLSDSLWRGIEWDWFVAAKDNHGGAMLWHWSPDYGWDKNHPIRGFNEAQIVYILGLASPTYPIKAASYHEGWVYERYGSKRTEFGIPMSLGHGFGGPLFFTHYSYLGFDPRVISYKNETYFEHFRKVCKVQVKYAQSKADIFKGYDELWGLTASADPGGYMAHAPGSHDNGTITPTAAISSMPYVQSESLDCLKIMYTKYGKNIWRDFGFTDAFNLSEDWVSETLIGIDVGTIAPMIENHRTGLCWKVFMRAPELKTAIAIMNGEL